MNEERFEWIKKYRSRYGFRMTKEDYDSLTDSQLKELFWC